MDIEELSKKIDKYHNEDRLKAERHQWWTICFIALGFAVATLSIDNYGFTVFFWIAGGVTGLIALYFKDIVKVLSHSSK